MLLLPSPRAASSKNQARRSIRRPGPDLRQRFHTDNIAGCPAAGEIQQNGDGTAEGPTAGRYRSETKETCVTLIYHFFFQHRQRCPAGYSPRTGQVANTLKSCVHSSAPRPLIDGGQCAPAPAPAPSSVIGGPNGILPFCVRPPCFYYSTARPSRELLFETKSSDRELFAPAPCGPGAVDEMTSSPLRF
ncbi:hypothetical protein EVAR_92523_1 [Eumeta japonica]|uniref:Uncharacterized protein n=1 Tax=Eumeta variegata TaxID=151549 RepID=A0A4C1T688_EUMVA|nr:hypothetical protein EVAR_92523_1 [Eumeta japonica]